MITATGTILLGDYLKTGINKLNIQRKTNGLSANTGPFKTDPVLKRAVYDLKYFLGKA